MKASERFVQTLAEGIAKLNTKIGEKKIKEANDMLVYQCVFFSITPGHEHNAKYEAEPQPWFEQEANQLKDAHIKSAIKAARKAAKRLAA